MARPSKYKDEYCEQAKKLCGLGATDAQMADFFKVTEKTFANWKNKHPEFLHALKKAKEISDSRVVRSLFERATGYSHPDSHITVIDKKVVITPITKHYAPDTTACIFWLKNRDKDNWRDKPDEGGQHDPSKPAGEYL
jgi:hypothetical protein